MMVLETNVDTSSEAYRENFAAMQIIGILILVDNKMRQPLLEEMRSFRTKHGRTGEIGFHNQPIFSGS